MYASALRRASLKRKESSRPWDAFSVVITLYPSPMARQPLALTRWKPSVGWRGLVDVEHDRPLIIRQPLEQHPQRIEPAFAALARGLIESSSCEAGPARDGVKVTIGHARV